MKFMHCVICGTMDIWYSGYMVQCNMWYSVIGGKVNTCNVWYNEYIYGTKKYVVQCAKNKWCSENMVQ